MVNDINNINAPQPGKPLGGNAPADSDAGKVSASDAVARDKQDSGDTVELSSQVQELNRIKEELKTQPDVDEARVAEVKAQIADGSFRADADQIAAQILVNEQDF